MLAIGGILVLIVGTILGVMVLQAQQNTRQFASEPETQVLQSVEIHPSSINLSVDSKEIGMSVLAYDTLGKPIHSGVTYEWGMSSVNSVGNISPTTGDISNFQPLAAGYGELVVTARSNGTFVQKSIPVVVSNSDGTIPTLIPTSTPTITPTPKLAKLTLSKPCMTNNNTTLRWTIVNPNSTSVAYTYKHDGRSLSSPKSTSTSGQGTVQANSSVTVDTSRLQQGTFTLFVNNVSQAKIAYNKPPAQCQ